MDKVMRYIAAAFSAFYISMAILSMDWGLGLFLGGLGLIAYAAACLTYWGEEDSDA